MNYKTGTDRDATYITTLDMSVDNDSWARVVDIFVDGLDLEQLGFKHATLNTQGNEPYHPSDMFKLIIYGQRHGLRSANKLSHHCKINLEVMWLLKGLRASARTICYFRTENEKAIKNAHQAFVKKLRSWKLIPGDLLALDSTKVRGQNSMKNNFNQRKIDRHLQYIDGKMEEYLQTIKKTRSRKTRKEIEDKLDTLVQRKEKYKEIEKQIEQSHDGQVSTVDPDARAVIKHRNIVEVGYNIQATVDAKHNMIVDMYVGSTSDRADLGIAAKRSQDILNKDKIDLLADAGYANGADMAYCERKGIRTFIPQARKHLQKEEGFNKSDFIYKKEDDTYTCPAGNKMTLDLIFRKKMTKRKYRVKRYKTEKCEGCPLRAQCTTSPLGRRIERPFHQASLDRNNNRTKRYHDYYRLRQQIVEPVFGILKRQWHFDHVTHKGKVKVDTEVNIVAITYNLLRLINVKGIKWLEKKLNKARISILKHLRTCASSHKKKLKNISDTYIYVAEVCHSNFIIKIRVDA